MRLDEEVRIPLGPVTLLVGANSSGKSSVLKAVHWAFRCAAQAETLQGQLKVSLERMDYAPSIDFRSLANRSTLQGRARAGSRNRPVKLGLREDNIITEVQIKALGNAAGVSVTIDGPLAETLTQEEAQSAYIPGLAGLSEQETVLARPVLRRKAASGDGGSVLRQILLLLHAEQMDTGGETVELEDLSQWVSKVIPGVRFWVRFDQRRDAFIDAWFFTPDMQYAGVGSNIATMRRPLEMAGTGLLQVTQIFAYLLFFKPKVLLIDEPDAHLHPTAQERLISALEAASNSFPNTQIILTTHAPRLVRAAHRQTEVVWINDGVVKETGSTARSRMGWGALDKEVFLFSEDANVDMLQSLLDQWPDIARRTAIWPCFGVTSLPDGSRLRRLQEQHGITALVHRDRDFMSDNDCAAWSDRKLYTENDVQVWFSPGSDIESCFHCIDHVANALKIETGIVRSCFDDAVNEFDEAMVRANFNEAYNSAVNNLPGAADAIGRWVDLGGFGISTIKGKEFRESVRSSV